MPPRASAYPSAVARARSNYLSRTIGGQEHDITMLPTWPASRTYAESRARAQAAMTTGSALSDIPTRPPLVGAQNSPQPVHNLAADDTMPDTPFIAPQDGGARERRARLFGPLDHVRWWLLRPGRLEFTLWTGGAVLLICVTSLLLFTMIVSIGARPGGQANSAAGTSSAHKTASQTCAAASDQNNIIRGNGSNCVSITSTSPAGLKVTMLDGDPVIAGSTLHLLGQGFSASGAIAFTHDADQPCQPATTEADTHGAFAVLLQLNDSSGAWEAGYHQIVIEDMQSQHTITLTFLLASTATATATALPTKTVQPTATPIVGQPPDSTGNGWGSAYPPASTGSQGNTDQPGSTNAPVPPPQPSPTAAPPVHPTPTVTAPTPVGSTPTVVAEPTTVVATPTPVSANYQAASISTLALDSEPLARSGWSTSPLLWYCIVGYLLAMLMFGIAGTLRRRG